jgi:putative Mg2+ transporter-C (MgtC) family protein
MDLFTTIGWQETALRLGSAVVIGGVLGLNRELRGKPAGMRTNALVCMGAALLTLCAAGMGSDPAASTHGYADAVSRTIQGIITGIGFLGGGVIIRDLGGTRVHGITTAATIWLSAVLGILCGIGMWAGAFVGLVLTLAILILGRPLEQFLHRRYPALTEEHQEPRPPGKG